MWKSLRPVWLFATLQSVHGILQARILERVAFLLQGIFPTQEWNPGLLHCRRILYQLSHKGSPAGTYDSLNVSQFEINKKYSSSVALATFQVLTAAAAKLLQSCPTLCDHIDGSPPGSLVPGILQARTLEWVVISFSNAWKWKVKVKSLSCVWLLATPWTVAHQAPPFMGFSRQE